MDEKRPSWKEKWLKFRQDLASGGRAGQVVSPQMAPSGAKTGSSVNGGRRPIAINLGVDFGTSYTKASYRMVGQEYSGVVRFSHDGHENYFFPSTLLIDPSGAVSMSDRSAGSSRGEEVRYLKMFLADQGIGKCPNTLSSAISDQPTKVWRWLSAFYLSRVIVAAKASALRSEKAVIGDSPVEWSMNLGVPVDYLESELLARFREVLHAAWLLPESLGGETSLQLLSKEYEIAVQKASQQTLDCDVQPELVAALSSFANQHQAAAGIYSMFDIGGGSLDGSAFIFERKDGGPKLNILTSKVGPLGFEAVCTDVAGNGDISIVRQALLQMNSRRGLPAERLEQKEQQIRSFISEVIFEARKKPGGEWFEKEKTFPVFMCGGGSESNWYVSVILGTHAANNHWVAGRSPPYARTLLSVPRDLHPKTLSQEDYHRLLVAYGLSIPAGQGPEVIGFPKDNPRLERSRSEGSDKLRDEQIEKYGKPL